MDFHKLYRLLWQSCDGFNRDYWQFSLNKSVQRNDDIGQRIERRTFYLLLGLEFCFYLICSMLSQTKSLFFTTTYFPCKLLGKSLSLPNTIFKTLMNYSQGLKRGNPLFLDEEKYQVIQHIISQKYRVIQLSLEKYKLVKQHSISWLNTIQCIFRK